MKRTLTGYPRIVGGPTGGNLTVRPGFDLDDQYGSTYYKLPEGDDSIAGQGVSVTHRGTVALKVVRVLVDVPKDCVGELRLDGKPLHTTDDGKGSVGAIELGDFAARAGLRIREWAVDFTNNSSGALNCRYYLIGFST